MKTRLVTAALLAGLILSACSGAPDAADVEQAIERNIRTTLAHQPAIATQAGNDRAGVPKAHDAIDISDVSIDKSKQLESGDYRLQVSYRANVGDISRRSSTQVILGQRDGEWAVLN